MSDAIAEASGQQDVTPGIPNPVLVHRKLEAPLPIYLSTFKNML